MSHADVTQHVDHRRRNTRRLLVAIALALVTVLIGANAHLVYVAFSSQPDCVTHLKGGGEDGTYRAAKSAC
jgi:phosphate starvation-inducible membrane PsiE